MKVKIDKSFERDAKRLPVQIQKEIKEVIQKILDAQSMQKLEVSKMEGAKNAYRIRLSNYRELVFTWRIIALFYHAY